MPITAIRTTQLHGEIDTGAAKEAQQKALCSSRSLYSQRQQTNTIFLIAKQSTSKFFVGS